MTNVGTNRYFGETFIDLKTLWPRKMTRREFIINQRRMHDQPTTNNTISERRLTIDLVPEVVEKEIECVRYVRETCVKSGRRSFLGRSESPRPRPARSNGAAAFRSTDRVFSVLGSPWSTGLLTQAAAFGSTSGRSSGWR